MSNIIQSAIFLFLYIRYDRHNIIIEVVKQVTRAFRSNDVIGRIGGDEFIVFVRNVRNPEDQIKQAKKLHEVLRQPVVIDGKTINKSASIGIALYPDHADSYEKLIECADEAMYKAKNSGRNAIVYKDCTGCRAGK